MGRLTYNKPMEPPPAGAPREAVTAAFASRLQKAILAKGWTQSQLAREAQKHIVSGEIRRDNISHYIRGIALPRPDKLEAMARALGVKPEDLLPRGAPSAADKAPSLDARDLGDGNAWLRVNQAVSWDVAVQILKMLRG